MVLILMGLAAAVLIFIAVYPSYLLTSSPNTASHVILTANHWGAYLQSLNAQSPTFRHLYGPYNGF